VRRRDFIGLVGGAVVAWPLAAQGQQAKVLRVGTAGIQPRTTAIYIAFLRRMAELGYEEGKNFVFEYVQVPNVDGYEGGYREVARRELDIVFTSGPEIALKSAIAVAGPLPIVMVAVDFDPLVRGYVKSLARPTDNLTGIFLSGGHARRPLPKSAGVRRKARAVRRQSAWRNSRGLSWSRAPKNCARR
jgi:putative tryptophan/tyrosine transport system substrate-binding protein